jgi:uncharacterized protein (DUF924 family)
MQVELFEDVLQFWFPHGFDRDQATLVKQWERWFRGGMDAQIIDHFTLLMERATRGELDHWSREPRSRLALLIVLDQFSRTIHRGTAQAFAQDHKACALAIAGIGMGHYASLETVYEKTFFILPLGHSEHLRNLDLVVTLADELVQEAPQEHRLMLEFSAAQARRHREVIARFGRQPHRNEALGRQSTSAELDYLATGQLVHTRPMPPHLSQFL